MNGFSTPQRHDWSEQLFYEVAGNAPIGMYVVRDGRFLVVNREFVESTGFSENELLDIPSLELVIAEERNAVYHAAVGMLKGIRSEPFEFRILRKDGSPRTILGAIVSISFKGSPAAFGYNMDVTGRK